MDLHSPCHRLEGQRRGGTGANAGGSGLIWRALARERILLESLRRRHLSLILSPSTPSLVLGRAGGSTWPE
jgi:hypothetical protein